MAASLGLQVRHALVKPCHGDVFYILHLRESLDNVPASVAQGATSRCQAKDLRMDVAKELGCGNSRSL